MMEVRGMRASSVIVHRVHAESADRFMEWQRGITAAAEAFPGYIGTDLYPTTDLRHPDWVVVIHFDDPTALKRWLDSSVRSEWTAKLPSEIRAFRLQTLPTGFGPWFAELVRKQDDGIPPSWKMALTVLLGLYPTVMLLSVLVGPYTSPLGLALSMLVGNALSVSILQWAVMPALDSLLGPWLRPKEGRGGLSSLQGLLLIILMLFVIALLFRQVTG
jgi:uncharacterized protein